MRAAIPPSVGQESPCFSQKGSLRNALSYGDNLMDTPTLPLSPEERQSYDNMLANLEREFSTSLAKEQAQTEFDLGHRHMSVMPGSIGLRYHMKRAIGMERLKIQALDETMKARGRIWGVPLATALRGNILGRLAEAEESLAGMLQDNARFEGRGRGEKLCLLQQFDEERGKLVCDLNILVANADIVLIPHPSVMTSAMRTELFVEDIDSFSLVKNVPLSTSLVELDPLRHISEAQVKQAFADVIGETAVPKDWGGERSDLFSLKVRINCNPIAAAFLFKGPGCFRRMTMASLGKNQDQIDRLFQEPADLLVLQHCHVVTQTVRRHMRAYAESRTRPRLFCIIDGFQTLRILRAYHKCGL